LLKAKEKSQSRVRIILIIIVIILFFVVLYYYNMQKNDILLKSEIY
jgi:ABC-type multidrug transport system permease subunit